MWLLNTTTLKLRSFFENLPDYVILSHTWGECEVTFEDIDKPHARSMLGYNKVVGCCKLAVRDGFEWAWIDTCCIDKRSSAELSEAINSMYDWYWQSAICYAYLSDVMAGEEWEQDLEKSRWFTRGWTLQELLAPDVVEFYNEAWVILGTKAKLIDVIERVTRIERRFLLSRETIRDASVGTKFSWAALRQTTRVEDMTYCLLGLVQVNMPMLYGEGKRAFYRLQLEFMKQSNEHSIFAWEPAQEEWQMTAVLAPSPVCFRNAANIKPTMSQKPLEATTHEVTNNGLRITLPTIPIGKDRSIALLDCQDVTGSTVGIWVENIGNGRYQRLSGSKLATLSKDEEEDAELLAMYLVVDTHYKDVTNEKPCHLLVSEVLTDRDCVINGITLSTRRHAATIVKPEYNVVIDGADMGREHLRHVLDALVVREGEAACIRVLYWNGSYFDRIPLVLGLRRGRPAIRSASNDEWFRTNWSETMRADTSASWDVVGDSTKVRFGSSGIVQAVAKKKCKTNAMQWTLVISVYSCSCGYTEPANREACICDTQIGLRLMAPRLSRHEWKDVLCIECKRSISSAKHPLCACNECRQIRGERGPVQNVICRQCREMFDEGKQLLAKNGRTHYMECPCSTCNQQSKICVAWHDGTEKNHAWDLVCDQCKPARDKSIQLLAQDSGVHYVECPCSLCEQESRIEYRVWHDGAEPWWMSTQSQWPQFTRNSLVRRTRSMDSRARDMNLDSRGSFVPVMLNHNRV